MTDLFRRSNSEKGVFKVNKKKAIWAPKQFL